MVWIDLFAVRQFPGNEADLDFRGVVRPPRPARPARRAPAELRPSAGLEDSRIRGGRGGGAEVVFRAAVKQSA